jgi:threonine dehydratase
MVLCSVGGGGFSAGLALGFHYLCPEIEMVLVEPEGYESFGASLAAKQVSRVSSAQNTICDALQATAPGKAPFACAQYAGVHSTLAVQDHSILQAMQFAFDHLKMVIEPSGAGAIAALLQHCDRFQGKRILAFTTGGNIAVEDFARHLLDNPEDERE